MLTRELANQMVEQTMIRLHHNINVMDATGIIVASGEALRLQQLHEGAAYVGRTGETLQIFQKDVEKWHGSKAGINLPLRHHDKIVAVIGITGNPNELASVAPLVQLTCELMLHQSIVTTESEWQRKWKDDAVTELFVGGELSASTVERANLSGVSLKGPLCCSVFKDVSGQTNTLRRKIEDFLEWPDKLVGIGVNEELVLITSGLSPERLVEKLERFLRTTKSAKVAVGKSVSSVQELQISLRSAQVTGQHQTTALAHFSEFEVTYLLDQVPTIDRESFSFTLLDGLDEKALETIRALLTHNLSIQQAATFLGIHRHTLSYRIEQIERLTGLDPLNFEHAVKFWLACEWAPSKIIE